MSDPDLLYHIALDYHVHKKLQRSIAEELGVSQVQVSKYLSKAEELGIIRVEVVSPRADAEEARELRNQLIDFFGIDDAVLTPSFVQENLLHDALYRGAAGYLFREFEDVPLQAGVGWGETTYGFVNTEFNEQRPRWRIIPLTGGSMQIASKFFNINHIANEFAEKLQAVAQPLYLPMVVEQCIAELFKTSSDYRCVEKLWSGLDMIVCGVGSSIPRSPLFRRGLLEHSHVEELRDKGVVGDILTHYFDSEGRLIEAGIEPVMINVSVDQIRAAGSTLVLACGPRKHKSIAGALRTGLVDVLITDMDTARGVLKTIPRGCEAPGAPRGEVRKDARGEPQGGGGI